MAQEKRRIFRAKRSSTVSGGFWRGQLSEETIDLRDRRMQHSEAHANNRFQSPILSSNQVHSSGKSISDIQLYKTLSSNPYRPPIFDDNKKNQTPLTRTSPKPEVLKSSFIKPLTSSNKDIALSRDQLAAELSAFDEYDLGIQNVLPRAPRLASIEGEQPLVEEVVDPQAQGEGVHHVTVSLIPRDHERKVSLVLSDPESDMREPGSDEHTKKLDQPTEVKIQHEILRDTSSSHALFQGKREQTQSTFATHPRRRFYSRKPLFSSLVLILMIGVGGVFLYQGAQIFGSNAQTHAVAAYGFMQEGREALVALNAKKAEEAFSKAQDEFTKMEGGHIARLNIVSLTAQIPVHTKITSAAHLVRAGKLLAEGGRSLALAIQPFQKDLSIKQQSAEALTDRLIVSSKLLKEATEKFERANRELANVRPKDVPSQFRDGVLAVQTQSNDVELVLRNAFSSLDILLTFLGHQEPKRYLLALQNSSELRATGGFIGTYGILELNKGTIANLFINGIYDPDGQLSVKVIPPKPLQYVTPNWGTRDANWFFDFPSSAKKLLWFFEHTGNDRPDGVIALTPTVIEKLLALTGPIELPEYNMTLTQENFLERIQQEVEVDYDKELNKPKQVLADFAPLLFQRLNQIDSRMELFTILTESLKRKDIQIYSRDANVENFMLHQKWGGAIEVPNDARDHLNDYLGITMSNVGGGKADRYTDTEVDSVTKITESGALQRSIILSRKHNGGTTLYSWYNKPNYSYTRFYVPKGSKLVSAEGFSAEPSYINTNYEREGYTHDPDIAAIEATQERHISGVDVFEESGMTVFGGWLWVPAGERQLVTLSYTVPLSFTHEVTAYQLMLQKQSGLSIHYSGTIENAYQGIQITNCQRGDEALPNSDFSFVEETDTTIHCTLGT